MGRSETIDRLNDRSEALGAVLNAYREDIKDIFYLEIVADSLPDRWFAENIESRGQLWLEITRWAFLSAECRADDIEVEKEDGKEEEKKKKLV